MSDTLAQQAPSFFNRQPHTGRRRARARDLRVETSSRADVFRDAWAQLEATGHATPFQTQLWLDAWREIIAPARGAEPLFVAVFDEHGDPAMLFPMCRRREGRIKVIEFADCGVSDYNAPLIAQGFDLDTLQCDRLLKRLCAALPPADLLRFARAPQFIGAKPNPLVTHRMFRPMSYGSWAVDLDVASDSPKPDATFARELQRKRRRLAGRGEVRFETARTREEAQSVFETLCTQRGARFAELERHNVLGETAFRAFYERVALTGCASGFAALQRLTVKGETVATIFSLRHGGADHVLMSAFESGPWKSSSPGNLVLDMAMGDARTRGASCLDFTIGDEPYKRAFGAEPRRLYAAARALSVFGAPQAVGSVLKAALRERLRRAPV